MQLDYKILWVEDNEGWKASIAPEIKRHIEDKGFNPIIETPSKEKLSRFDNGLYKDIDLMLIDYNLKYMSTDNGDALIQKIRHHRIYTNIVFYSSDMERLDREIKEKKLSGVYIFDRRQLDLDGIEDLFELIDFFLEKEMDNNSLRGIAMSEVAEFDSKIWNIIKTQESDLKSDVADVVKNFRLKKYNEFKDQDADRIWESIDKKGTIVLDSFHLHKFLCDKILSILERTSDIEDCMNNYHSDVLTKRNDLAHSKKIMDYSEQIYFRKDLIKFRKIFAKLESELCKKP